MKRKSLLWVLSLCPLSGFAANQTLDLTERLFHRNEMVKSNEIIKTYVHDADIQERLALWVNHPKNKEYIEQCQTHLGRIFRSRKVLSLVCYFSRNQDVAIRSHIVDLAERFLWEKKLALFDIETDPRYRALKSQNRVYKGLRYSQIAAEMRSVFNQITRPMLQSCLVDGRGTRDLINFDAVMSKRLTASSKKSQLDSPFYQVYECLIFLGSYKNQPILLQNLGDIFPNHPSHAISETGWIDGNHVEYLTYNRTDPEFLEILEKKVTLVQEKYPLEGAGSRKAMREALRQGKEIFSESEGFYNIHTDPTWSQDLNGPHGEKSIFPSLLKGINSAKESIFIDIFFLGGPMGASLVKHLISMLEKNPQLKIFIIRDLVNHFGHEKEMLPVYNFLKEYSLHNPKQMLVVPAHIRSHKSGLPKFMWGLASDELFMRTGLQGHLALYGRATSDHSKVIVIDGLSKSPLAFVGSKNITDASGGACWDEVAQISGPAATVVLDDFYEDMFHALMEETSLNELMHYSLKGWAQDIKLKDDSKLSHVVRLLQPFDVLKRDNNRVPSVKKVEVPRKGVDLVRNGFNNYDSTRASALDQVVQAILFAKEKIFIKDQYLFDRNVILALVRAKESNPNLDIRIILEPMAGVPIPGMPNILYADVLRDAGIAVKFKKTHMNPKVSQEYHMKTLSVDGTILITGSANKDQTTMYGSFREQQAEIYNKRVTSVHDDKFEREWADPHETSEVFKEFTFKVPSNLKGFDGNVLSPSEMIRLIRSFLALLYDAAPPSFQ